MGIQDLGALGEFVAAIATVGTLGYLALQIRLSARTSMAEAERQLVTGLHTQHILLWGDEASSRLMLKGLSEGLGNLTDEETMMFSARMSEMVNQYMIAKRMTERKVIRDDLRRELRDGIGLIVNSPGGRQWCANASWAGIAEEFSDLDGSSFQEWFEGLRSAE
jgi:hypothetical protein